MSDLDEKIKEAADNYNYVPVADLREVFMHGANCMRELMQKEIDRCSEIAERDGKDYSDLKAKLAIAVEALENYFYNFTHSDECNACNNTEILNSDMYAALSKIKGGAE